MNSTVLVVILVVIGAVIMFSKGHRVGHRGGHLQHYRTTPEEGYRKSRLVRNTRRGVPHPPLSADARAKHMKAAIRAEVHEASGFKPKSADVRSRNVLRAHRIKEEDWKD